MVDVGGGMGEEPHVRSDPIAMAFRRQRNLFVAEPRGLPHLTSAFYSRLSVAFGSTRVARQAGTAQASIAVKASSSGAAVNVTGSVGATSKSKPRIKTVTRE